MVRSLYTSATGMEAQQLYMDNISNNLSNVNTTGFKRTRLEFQDLLYQTLREPGSKNYEGAMAPAGIEVGLGVRPAATYRDFQQGSMNQSGNSMDLAISGDGFLQISMPDGSTAYTRDGSLKLSADGTIVTSSGFPVYPQMTIPEGAESFTVDANGRATVILPGEQTSTQIGQFELARFINPAGLRDLGGNLYQVSDASGEPVLQNPGENGMGTLQQGYTEASNVQVVQEMVNMITAQRAYEIVSKSIQVSEDMMQVADNLKR
jgi:flagellar basal-body rod protein FlgG